MTKLIGALVLIVLIMGGAYYYWHTVPNTDLAAEATPAPTEKIVPKWSFAEAGVNEATGAGTTKVTLTLGSSVYDAGTYNGSCSEIGAEGGVDGTGLLDGEVSGVQCWFAGGGDEVGLFREGEGFALKHGELGEPQGDGTGAFRGNFATLLTL